MDPERLRFVFTFRSRQALHKKLKGIKEAHPILKDWKFGFHDLRRLKAREQAAKGGVRNAKEYLGHSNEAVTMLYLDNN